MLVIFIKAKKILFVIPQGFKTFDPVYTHTFVTCKFFKKNGYEASVLMPKINEHEESITVIDEIAIMKYDYHVAPKKTVVNRLRHLIYPHLIHILKADIVYVRSPTYLSVIISKLFNKFIIGEINSLSTESVPSTKRVGQGWVKKIYHNVKYRYYHHLLNICDLLLVQTSELKNGLKKQNISPNIIEVLPNGVDTDIFKPTLINNNFNVLRLVYVGALDENHDLSWLFGLKENSKLCISVIGYICTNGRSCRSKGIDEFLKSHNVIFKGTLNHEHIPNVLQKHDIGIATYNKNLPNFKEYGFYFCPLKILEYLACGLPVITNVRNSYIDELIEEGVVFFCEDEKQFNKVVEQFRNMMKSNLQDFLDIKKAARQSAINRNWDVVFAKLEEDIAKRIN